MTYAKAKACPSVFLQACAGKVQLVEALNTEVDAADCLQIFKDIGGEKWSSLRALNSCMGDIDEDKASPILDKEMVGQRGNDQVPSFEQLGHLVHLVQRRVLSSDSTHVDCSAARAWEGVGDAHSIALPNSTCVEE